MTSRDRLWVLAEFVGGPSDGHVLPIEASTLGEFAAGVLELAAASSHYRAISTPSDPDALDEWADREHSVIAEFGAGSPRYFVQMQWKGHEAPPRSRRSRIHRPVAS